jgi:hypothetical protein
MDNKITVIEGPPPTFETVEDGWVAGLNEGPYLYDLALTRLRTFNGQALVERCYRTWNLQNTMFFHYRNELGLEQQDPIMAARALKTTDGDVLLLWVRREPDDEDFDDLEDDLGDIDEGDEVEDLDNDLEDFDDDFDF